MVNGSQDPDREAAKELFPHTAECSKRRRLEPCRCSARKNRNAFLVFVRHARRQAYADACAKIRHEAKLLADQAVLHAEQVAYTKIMMLAEELEEKQLNG